MALPGTTTTINLPAGHYVLSLTQGSPPVQQPLSITGQVAIVGQGAATTTIDAAGNSQVFNIGAAGVASMTGVTVTGGLSPEIIPCQPCTQPVFGAPGGGIVNAGSLTLTGVVITANATGAGHSALSATGIGDNAGPGGAGGGIDNTSTGTLAIVDSTISSNTAGDGGAGTLGGSGALQGGFGGNGGAGGAIANTGTVTITGSTISGNKAGNGGAGGGGGGASSGAAGAGGASGNGGAGGAIDNVGSLSISDTTIVGNKAGTGAVGGAGGTGTGGATGGNGGAGGTGGDGGAIESLTNWTITNSTILNNASGAGAAGGSPGTGGGGVAGLAGGPGNGGGINQAGAGGTLTHDTVTANVASGSGGGLNASGGALTIGNSIVASNQGVTAAMNCAGMITDTGGNVTFGDASCPSGFLNADPKLASALADNGGPTQTLALLSGSAAIGHVTTCVLASDQRGAARPVGSACDSGAYEFAPPTIAAATAAASSTATATVTASINPNLSAKHTTVLVDYGPTTAYGSTTAVQDLGAGNSAVAFSAAISGLTPGTTYHARIVATNGDGTSSSADLRSRRRRRCPRPCHRPRPAGARSS